MDKLNLAFEQFDRYNQQDPVLYYWNNKPYPQEYFLAIRVYDEVLKLVPEASEALLLAARCHHIGRWEIPRDNYPAGRRGYLTWRNRLAFFHADKSAAIMEEVGYEPGQIARVRQLVLKKHMKADAEAQILENASCLVFLQFQYEEFRQKHSREKVVNILRKSLLKMDQQGRSQALALEYSEAGQEHIVEALKTVE